MNAIALTVNGVRREALVEPRTHLADMLREQLSLTGTHLGCEQGVCGACTVLIDGRPMRSCIAFAVACDGSEIMTIEGFEDDAVMSELREAFSQHHGLQCGFCAPGMLITSRDIVRRFGETDENTIRRELSGNLCRCTGYVGIVRAVQSVAVGKTPIPPTRAIFAEPLVEVQENKRPKTADSRKAPAAAKTGPAVPQAAMVPTTAATSVVVHEPKSVGDGWTELGQSVTVGAPTDAVWKALTDVRGMANCLPGASIEDFDGKNFVGVLTVKFGPIRAAFGGDGTVVYEDGTRSGLLEGGGSDKRTGSQVRGVVEFQVEPEGETGSVIQVKLRYRITGSLAQFARGALVVNFVGHLAGTFAENLGRMVYGGDATTAPAKTELNVAALMLGVVKSWLLRLVRTKKREH